MINVLVVMVPQNINVYHVKILNTDILTIMSAYVKTTIMMME